MKDYSTTGTDGLVRTHLGELLYLLLAEYGYSQRKLSQLSRISPGEISRIINCKVVPSLETTIRLAVGFSPQDAAFMVQARDNAEATRLLELRKLTVAERVRRGHAPGC